jgi:hypothetical protein
LQAPGQQPAALPPIPDLRHHYRRPMFEGRPPRTTATALLVPDWLLRLEERDQAGR